MRFRPSPVPTVFVVIALIILLNLGFWQIRRAGETDRFIDRVHATLDGPPLHNADLTRAPAELTWHRGELTGTYVGQEYPMTGRFEFGGIGYDVIQAFAVDGGPTILVDRGWFPREGFADAVAAHPPGTTASGLILDIAEYKGAPDVATVPADAEGPERWPPNAFAAIAARAKAAPLVLIAGEPVEVGVEKTPTLPVTGYRPTPSTRPHMQYAGTWFTIAATLVALWLWAGVRRAQQLAAEGTA
jgi:surfeit locus 1 family protein